MSLAPSPQVPLTFGAQVSCGWDGDKFSVATLLLFGTGNVSMDFALPASEPSIQVSVVALQVGSPTAPLVLSLYSGKTLLGTVSVPAAVVPTGSPGWLAFQPFTGPFPPGYYTVVVSSPGSASPASCHRAFINFEPSWVDPKAVASYTPPPGYNGNSGSPVVWVQDGSGNDIAVLPFGVTLATNASMTFTAQSDFPVSSIVPWLSDMDYAFKPYTAAWTLKDLTTGAVLGSAPATQAYNSHGVFGLIPFGLPSPVNLVQGHQYQVSMEGSRTYVYQTLLRACTIDPAKAAPPGVPSTYWYGALAYADFSLYRVLDYPNRTILSQGSSGYIGGQAQVGVRFVPGAAGTLEQLSLRMFDGRNTVGFHPPGTPVAVSIFASNDNVAGEWGSQPAGSPLASVTVDSGTVPYNGFFDAPGFGFPLAAGTAYWAVWSSPSAADKYVPQRCVSAWRNLALTSADGGGTWSYPGQGPSDVSWHGALSGGSYIGSPYDTEIDFPVSATSWIAEPFILGQAAAMSCVYLNGFRGNPLTAVAKVYPDNGSGTGPNLSAPPLGEGSFDTNFTYLFGVAIIPFGSGVASLQANTKYWIVLSTSQGSGKVEGASYWTRPSDPPVPQGYEVLLSSNSGGSWNPASSEVATAIFMVGVDPGAPPPPTPTPTTLTLTAKAV